MPGLRKHHLDFEILDTGNPKTLVFVDSSDYFELPERPLAEVTMPGYRHYFLVNIEAKVVNTFNSSTLGLNTVLDQSELCDLPDGIWTIKYKICPYTEVFVIKTFARLVRLYNQLAQLHSQIDLAACDVKESKEIQDNLFYIYNLIEGAKVTANIDEAKASKYYQLADKLIQKALKKFCQNCR